MTIFVIDDSRTVRYVLVKYLTELGYDKIIEAEDVPHAVFLMTTMKPDLIFSDFNMPGKSGLDLLKHVRATPDIATVPFVMVTTVHEKKIIFEAVKAGLQHYIFKPCEKDVLASKLQTLVQTHGIQAPILKPAPVYKAPTAASATVASKSTAATDEKGAKEATAFSEETIVSLIKHFFLIFDGELTMSDFHTWITETVLPIAPASLKGKSAEDIVVLLRKTAEDAILESFRKLSAS